MDERLQLQMQEFQAFLRKKYAWYVGNVASGSDISQTEFAKWIGVTQASYSNWINAVRPPNRENLDQIASKLGPEAYDIFDVPRHIPKDKDAKKVMERWHLLNTNQRRHLVEMTENFLDDNGDETKKGGQKTNNMAGSPA